MASTSAILNRSLRKHVTQVLRDAGFQQIDARNAWSWRDESIWVFNIRAVGSYFAGVTGWPPGSVCVWLGVYFTFAPQPSGLPLDVEGRARPPEHLCHMRSHLDCGLDQSARTRQLANKAERERADIWWVEPDGSNADDVAGDIATAVVEHGLPWFTRLSDPRNALAEVEASHDSFIKFTKAALLAKRIGDHERWHKYDALAEAEALRIGQSPNRCTWSGI